MAKLSHDKKPMFVNIFVATIGKKNALRDSPANNAGREFDTRPDLSGQRVTVEGSREFEKCQELSAYFVGLTQRALYGRSSWPPASR